MPKVESSSAQYQKNENKTTGQKQKETAEITAQIARPGRQKGRAWRRTLDPVH
jgi:hypothetical protein